MILKEEEDLTVWTTTDDLRWYLVSAKSVSRALIALAGIIDEHNLGGAIEDVKFFAPLDDGIAVCVGALVDVELVP